MFLSDFHHDLRRLVLHMVFLFWRQKNLPQEIKISNFSRDFLKHFFLERFSCFKNLNYKDYHGWRVNSFWLEWLRFWSLETWAPSWKPTNQIRLVAYLAAVARWVISLPVSPHIIYPGPYTFLYSILDNMHALPGIGATLIYQIHFFFVFGVVPDIWLGYWYYNPKVHH